jgi:hypothetical protein
MITQNISLILYVTGAITTSMLLMFAAPVFLQEKILKVRVEGEVGMLYARHWGMEIFLTGALLIYAGYDPAVRVPVVLAVTLGKASFVGLVLANIRKDYAKRFITTILFDALCVLLYALYLAGLA